MPPRTIDDKSLLRCTLRKSADVLAKLVLYASCAVCGATGLVLAAYGMFALASALANPVRAIIDTIWNWTLPSQIFASIVGVLAAIPWYVYVGIAVVAAIPVYSLLWCINRELEEKDHADIWDNDFGLTFALSIAWLVVGILISCFFITVFGYDQVVVLFGALAYLLGIPTSYVVTTYLHYRKRMKGERK